MADEEKLGAIAEILDEHHESDEVDEQALTLAEGAVELAEQQSALAHIQAAAAITEAAEEIREQTQTLEQLQEQNAWLTMRLTALETTVEKQAQTLLQLESALLTPPILVPETPTEPAPVETPIPVMLPENAEENLAPKTEVKKKKSIRRV